MKVLRIIVGIVLALVALFAGGCSVFWTVILANESDPYEFWRIAVLGYLAAAVAGALAWWALSDVLARTAAAPPGGEDGDG